MLKIKFKTKKVLREAEIKYSNTAFNQMFDFIMKHFENYRDVVSYDMDIPLDEVLYTKNKNILSGFVAFIELDLLKKGTLQNLVQYWDAKSGEFSDEIIKKYLDNYYYPFSFIITNKIDSQGSVSIAGTQRRAVLRINVERIESQDEIKTTLQHELQHLTQLINGHCLKYSDLLKKNRADITKVQSTPYQLGDKKFGVGKQKTGLKQDSSMEQDYSKATPEQQIEILKNYFGDDFEYETWQSELAAKYLNWLRQSQIITNSQLRTGLTKDKIKNNPQEKYKIVKDIAKQYNMPDSEALQRLNAAPSLHKLATEKINDLISNNEKTQEEFTATLPSGHMYSQAIVILNHLRKKEFAKDLINNLVLRMQKSV